MALFLFQLLYGLAQLILEMVFLLYSNIENRLKPEIELCHLFTPD
jgi:hypothetical protein